MAAMNEKIKAQVCYLTPDAQRLHHVILPLGVTIKEAIVQSGILNEAPEIDLAIFPVGIYSKKKSLDTEVREGDRVEIYRPLVADPKESRRRRAQKKY
jgi:putative ubiquitin-RnfH superfamily antitoxin RatB of RatAB toxin-antitoxin module